MKAIVKSLTLLLSVFIIAACGGGGSLSRDTDPTNPTTPTQPDPVDSVALSLVDQNNTADSTVSTTNPLTLVATVTDSDGNPKSGELVTFSFTQANLASFNNDAGTAVSGDDGIARIGITVGEDSGSGQITAVLQDGETASIAFTSEGTPDVVTSPNTVALSMVDGDGNENNTLNETTPLTVIATVRDGDGNPMADQLVTFTFNQADLAEFDNDAGTALTSADGTASIGLLVGQNSGSGQVIATLAGGETSQVGFVSEGAQQVEQRPSSIELFASAIQMSSSGSDDVELIALVKNDQSVLLEGIDVSFSVPSSDGVELQITQGTTEADGTARALLSTRNNATNRTVVVTAQTGELSQNVEIEIVGTEILINGATSIILNDSVELTIRVQDSDGVSIPNTDVALSATSGTLASDTVRTGANGQATVQYTGTQSGEDTVTATALNASGTIDITIQEDQFTFTTVPSDEIALGDTETLVVTWNKDGSPFAGGTVTFTASRGVIDGASTVTTDASGQASFDISSSNAGISAITASGIDSDSNEVTARTEIEFIATVPDSIQTDATPDQIGPDGQTSTITAIVRDPSGNLVKGAVVSFNVDDTSTGSISPSQATTDGNGIASTVFTSGSVTSEDAVRITAAVSGTSVQDEVTLTVGQRAFDVSIGTGNIIGVPDDATYLKEFAVFVTDAVGQPIENVELTVSATPIKYANSGVYRKGAWSWTGTSWVISSFLDCPNEDSIDPNGILDLGADTTNRNGTLDMDDDSNGNGILEPGEDLNDDGFLTPGIVGSITFKDTNLTDENGQATIELRYPKEFAGWYEAEITVFAQSTGSEASAATNFTFSAAATDLDDVAEVPPPSPFGTIIDPATGCNTSR